MGNAQGLIRDTNLDGSQKNELASSPMLRPPGFNVNDTVHLVQSFSESVARAAGEVIKDVPWDVGSFVRTKFRLAKVICSAVPECEGTMRPTELGSWSEASKIDVAVVRSPMGIAETGSVLLSDMELQINTIAFLAHDLVVLLDPAQIVQGLRDAYRHPYFGAHPYSLLMTGPPGSPTVRTRVACPNEGGKTLTVLLLPVSK